METIFKRRSIRKYTGEKVPEELIEQILRAGMAAPTAKNTQPWHFVVIDDREVLGSIPKFHPFSKMLEMASHGIVVCGDLSKQELEGYLAQDCGAAMENMLLMACELGLGAVWLGIYPVEERIKPLKELIKLPSNIIPFSIMSVGYPAEEKEPINRFDLSKVHRNQW